MLIQKTEKRRKKKEERMQKFFLRFLSSVLCPLFSVLCFYLFLSGSVCIAGEVENSKLLNVWDPNKYIDLDEIRPGMEAYCLTCFQGTEIERFDLDILSVVRNVMPGRNWILVLSTDKRFIHTGPVAGCSGSPVYIQGRMAGAIAYVPGGAFNKEPLFGVTPIREMLNADVAGPLIKSGQSEPMRGGYMFDFSKPISLSDIGSEIKKAVAGRSNALGGTERLPGLLIGSGLSPTVYRQLNELVEPLGLMVVAGGSGSSEAAGNSVLQPGSCVAVPWVTGDISLAWFGTVTEVVGEKVFSFGHSLTGYGPVDLPMATGKVHTVVSNLAQSFKLASVGEVVGSLQQDTSVATVGQMGKNARMIPLKITVDCYNDTGVKTYNCRLANNRTLTPLALQLAVLGAASRMGELPLDHTIEYEINIGIQGKNSVDFKNVSTSRNLTEIMTETIVPIALLLNNPFEQVDISSVNIDIRITPTNSLSNIWSVELSDSKVEPGQEIEVAVVLQSFLAEKKKYRFNVKIPEQLKPGEYSLTLCGSYGYEQFLLKTVPHRFVAQNMSSLIVALNDALSVKRDELYCIFVLPRGGLAVERAELPNLPATKALVLQNSTRALSVRPYPHWLEQTVHTDTVVLDSEVMRITVK